MDNSVLLGSDDSESREPQLPVALGNEVTGVSNGPLVTNSTSSNGHVPLLTDGSSQMPPPEQSSQPSEEVQVSKEDRDTSEEQKSSANPSLYELQRILDQIEDWEDTLSHLKGYTSQRRKRVVERRARSSSRDSQEQKKRISIPQLNYVSWSTMNEHGYRKVPDSHYAIDIPNSEPTPSQLKVSSNRMQSTDSSIEAPNVSTPNPLESSAEKKELPERIRINSKKLITVLDQDLADNNLIWNSSAPSPFVILRPFKILVCLEFQIRNRLKEFEQARLNQKSATEEEYLEELEKTPAFDDPSDERQDLSSMSLSELTGTINDLRCLTKFMDEIQIPAQRKLRDNPNQVRFSDLWCIFTPGSLVMVKDKNIPQKVWKVIQRTGGRRYLKQPDDLPGGDFLNKFSPFVLDCYHLDYDGLRYVQSYQKFRVTSFDGRQSISLLPVYPFSVFLQENPSYQEELLARGRQFMECTKPCHRRYSGRTQLRTPSGAKLSEGASHDAGNVSVFSERVESEVIVDFERALQEVPWWRPGTDDLAVHKMDSAEIDSDDVDYIDRDRVWDARFTADFVEAEAPKRDEWEKAGPDSLQDDDILLLPDRVFAFVLRTRKWACLQIGKDTDGKERLTRIEASPEPWNKLELPDGHKDIVQSSIESHFSTDQSKNVHWDLVKDKGKGVVILLHGVPGVGKTSTAECAAESNKRPLLPITCGDLGLSPKEVEAKLQESFRLAQAWNCVMLLDEADVFLAQRSPTDTQRNALVSVFLRVLEYYEGVLFLTTNRVGTFDEAFKSRIHLSLYYPPLNWPRTKRIWTNHIKTATSGNTRIQVDHDTLIAHAESLFQIQSSQNEFGPVWNGRQIRNAFQCAVALASFRRPLDQPIPLGQEHFDKVSKVSHDFNHYLFHVKRANNDADLAKLSMSRYDNYVPAASSMPMSSQQIVVPEGYSQQQQPMSTFGRNMMQAMTAVPVGGGFMPNMPVFQQAQSQPYSMTGINGGTGMVQASFPAQAFGTQPPLQQMRQEQPQTQPPQQQSVFNTQTQFQQIRQEQQQPGFSSQTQFQQIRQQQQQPQQPLLGPSPALYNQQPNQNLPLQAQ